MNGEADTSLSKIVCFKQKITSHQARHDMNDSLFARPNLKLFVAGAFLILVLNHFLTGTTMEASARAIPLVGKNGQITEEEFQRLLEFAAKYPSADSFFRISYCYEKRGDFKKAMQYITMAERYAHFED